MNFSSMTGIEKKESLCKLHNALNAGLFNNTLGKSYVPQLFIPHTLPSVSINLGDLRKEKYDARFDATYLGKEIIDEEMFFDIHFLEKLDSITPEEKKIGILASVMLHEMIHQHLHETHRALQDDDVHSQIFVQDGLEHGYHYLLGACYADKLLRNNSMPQQRFRHKKYDLLSDAEAIIQDFHF